jgi:thioredoxin 1
MNQTWKVVIVAVLIVSVITVLTIKRNKPESTTETATDIAASADDAVQPDQLVTNDIPILIDLGSDECIPCKEMAPILEELKTEYADKFKVEFMDVRIDPMLTTVYNIKLIPTQIFFDASGKELFRHEGFYSKEDILSKWKELGYEMTQTE